MRYLVRKGFSVSPIGYALALVLLLSSLSYADITYTDFASWAAANPGYVTVTIPDPAPDQFTVFGTGNASVTYSGVQFSQSGDPNTGPDLFNIGSLDSGNPAVLSSASSNGDANILITLPQPMTALALDYSTWNGSPVAFALSNGTLFNQASTAVSGNFTVPDFFGVKATSPFQSVMLTSPDLALNLNNVSFVSSLPSASVPEPETWPVLAGFLIFLAGTALWRKQCLS